MVFAGRQVRFDIDGDELVLVLLPFSVEQLRCVVVELKIGRFDPGYVGQLGTYVVVVDHQLERSPRRPPFACVSRAASTCYVAGGNSEGRPRSVVVLGQLVRDLVLRWRNLQVAPTK